MKIEKINDNQIKCTLPRSDLASHQLRLSEIAYGTEKANNLFRDMMDQASLEFGLEFSDFPVAIEAIPVSMDCIILMITKLEEPEEVDTDVTGLSVLKELAAKDFSDDLPFTDDYPEELSAGSGLLQLESLLTDVHRKKDTGNDCLLSFSSLETVMQFARQIDHVSFEESSLYKSSDGSSYYLYLALSSRNPGDYAYVSTIALEFGSSESASPSRVACIREHCELLLHKNAVPRLASV